MNIPLERLADRKIETVVNLPVALWSALQSHLNAKPDWDSDRTFTTALSLLLLQFPSSNCRAVAQIYLNSLFTRPCLPVFHESSAVPIVDRIAFEDGKKLLPPREPENLIYMKCFAQGQHVTALKAISEAESAKQELKELKVPIAQLLTQVNCAIAEGNFDERF